MSELHLSVLPAPTSLPKPFASDEARTCEVCQSSWNQYERGGKRYAACSKCDRIGLSSEMIASLRKAQRADSSMPPMRAAPGTDINTSVTQTSCQPERFTPKKDRALSAATFFRNQLRSKESKPELEIPLRFELMLVLTALLSMGLFELSRGGRFFNWFLSLSFHELGHALPAWLASQKALPLPIGFTSVSDEQSIFAGICVVFLVGLFVLRSYQERRYAGVILGSNLIGCFLWLTFFSSPSQRKEWMLLGGQSGEIWLPVCVLLLFFMKLPHGLRWDWVRLLFVVPAAASFAHSQHLWAEVKAGITPLPRGSMWGNASHGDIDRLIAGFGWTEHECVLFWSRQANAAALLGFFCLAAIIYLRLEKDSQKKAAAG